MPTSNYPVDSTKPMPWQPYDAGAANDLGKWKSVDENSGPADETGHATGNFEDGPAPWRQTL